MKIAYISLHWPRTRDSGVGKKISSQMSLWRELGHEARLLMHMHDIGPGQELIEGEAFPFKYRRSLKYLLPDEISRSRALRRMIGSVNSFQPDLIYFRNSMYAFPLQEIFTIAPVVVEVASNDVFEHRHLGFPFSLYNRLTRGISLSRSSGMVFLSGELSRSPHYMKFKKPFVVIGDGIPLDQTPFLPAPNNRIPHVVFIGSPGKVWHGVDKLIGLARHCPDIRFMVIGYDGSISQEPPPANLEFLGYLRGDQYLEALSQADAALSSLALHRINIQEMSPLKTRECVALGIPTILPYTDTDLQHAATDKILEIDNNEKNAVACAGQIHDFAYRMLGRRIERDEIKNLIDSSMKEKQRLSFFEEILGD